jgi:ABC-2 type transport system ATP-binding protein
MAWQLLKDNIITVSNLSKSFGEIKAVDNISFNVGKGEIFAFLGPNGAGKSTTIKMLTTLLHPTTGQIMLNGFDTIKNPKDVRKSFGIIFQDASLDEDLTAYENMQLHGVFYHVPTNISKERVEKLLKVTELWDRKDDLVKHFSGGMKRRLEIARGLLHHPKIFFLDEPTVGLDPQTRNHIWDYIKELNKTENITIFFTTHYMDEAARYASRIAVIDHGKIITEGTAQDLINKTGKTNLEDAFIELTGHDIRSDEASSLDKLRNQRKMRMGGRR